MSLNPADPCDDRLFFQESPAQDRISYPDLFNRDRSARSLNQRFACKTSGRGLRLGRRSRSRRRGRRRGGRRRRRIVPVIVLSDRIGSRRGRRRRRSRGLVVNQETARDQIVMVVMIDVKVVYGEPARNRADLIYA